MNKLKRFAGIFIIGIAFSLVSASVSAQDECGNCDSDGGVDIADMTFLIGYLFIDNPPPIGDCDLDEYEGISARDFMVLNDHLFANFKPLICPTTNPKFVAIPDSSFSVLFRGQIPSGSVSVQVPLYIETPRELFGIQLPIQFRIDDIIPSIDSLHTTDKLNTFIKGGWIVHETGESVVSFFPIAGSLHLPNIDLRPNHLADLFLSFPPSNVDRNLTAQWTMLSPIQAVEADSTVIAAVYSSVPEGAVGWEPVLKSYICGDVDDSGDSPDIADLTFLIDHLFINFPPLVTTLSGNIDGIGGVDIGDLTLLIDHLFINFPPIGC